jgi:DNA polymerase-1
MVALEKFKELPGPLSLDTETNREPGDRCRMELFSVAAKKKGKVIGGAYPVDRFDEFWDSNKRKLLVFHNAKYDLQVLKAHGKKIDRISFEDTMIMASLLDETRRKGLKELRVSVLGKKDRDKWEDVDKQDIQKYKEYAKEDAIDTLELYYAFFPEIVVQGLEVVYDLEKAVIYPTIEMEYYGIKVDRKLLLSQKALLEEYIEEIYKKIIEKVGFEINLRSSKQMQDLFFSKLGYSPLEEWRNKTGYSVAVGVLEYMSRDRNAPVVQDIAGRMLRHRKYSKLQSAFVLPILDKLDSKDYLRASFNGQGTVTGRFSSSGPNLQQISRDEFVEGDLDTHLRSIFICEPDEYLLGSDYSQIELRVAAELSRDKAMIKAFLAGVDIHQRTADLVSCSRSHAKTLNFGVLYGMGPGAFSLATGISFEEAREYISKFWREYHGLEAFFDSACKEVMRHGYVRTMSGRKRRFFGVFDEAVKRRVVNTIVQGTAADLIKLAMVYAYKNMDNSLCRFGMQVHDELVMVTKDSYAEEAMEILRYSMEKVISTLIPLRSVPKLGFKWSEIK